MRVKAEGIRVGSYPSFQKGVTVSLIGPVPARLYELGGEVSLPRTSDLSLISILQVCREVDGTIVEPPA